MNMWSKDFPLSLMNGLLSETVILMETVLSPGRPEQRTSRAVICIVDSQMTF